MRWQRKKTLAAWGLALVTLVQLAGCQKAPNAETLPEKTVASFVGALKKGDVDDAKRYISVDSATVDALDRPETKAIASFWFSQVDIAFPTHIEAGKDDATAIVRAKVTAPDAQALVARIEEELGHKLSEATSMSQSEATALFSSIMIDAVKGDLPKTSREVDVSLEKDADGNWKIVPTQDFLGALAGGLDELKLS